MKQINHYVYVKFSILLSFTKIPIPTNDWNVGLQIPNYLIKICHQTSQDQNWKNNHQIATKQKQEIPWMVDIPIPQGDLLCQIHNTRNQGC